MKHQNGDYPVKDTGYIKSAVALIGIVVLVLAVAGIGIFGFVMPNALSFISWFVPNFWSILGYIVIIWLIWKFFTLLWYPIYSVLGRWSYLILLATAIYILMQITV